MKKLVVGGIFFVFLLKCSLCSQVVYQLEFSSSSSGQVSPILDSTLVDELNFLNSGPPENAEWKPLLHRRQTFRGSNDTASFIPGGHDLGNADFSSGLLIRESDFLSAQDDDPVEFQKLHHSGETIFLSWQNPSGNSEVGAPVTPGPVTLRLRFWNLNSDPDVTSPISAFTVNGEPFDVTLFETPTTSFGAIQEYDVALPGTDDSRTGILVNGELDLSITLEVDNVGLDYAGLVIDPLQQPYVPAFQELYDADEVTYDNTHSAFYRFTFELPPHYDQATMNLVVSLDDQGVVFLNGAAVSGLMTVPEGCSIDPDAPECRNELDFAKAGPDENGNFFDVLDESGARIIAWPRPYQLTISDADRENPVFKPGLNELVFAVAGNASIFEPTGLEFSAEVSALIPNSIAAAEYYFDKDPGEGNGIEIPDVTAGQFVQLFTEVNIPDHLCPGYHTLFVRAMSEDGVWGLPRSQRLFVEGEVEIVELAYGVDIDPGDPDAEWISLSEWVVDDIGWFFLNEFSTEGLDVGNHSLYVRAKNSCDIWGPPRQFTFNVGPASEIVYVEVFADTDPGKGNALQMLKTETDLSSSFADFLLSDLPVDSYELGTHSLFARAQDSYGRWSLTEISTDFEVRVPSFSEWITNFPELGDLILESQDPDNDGLTNLEEFNVNTHPHLSDSDADGMLDGVEVTYVLDPLKFDAHLDPDRDGYSNYIEITYGGDPHVMDEIIEITGDEFIFRLGDAFGGPGSEVVVPVQVYNFTDIMSFQFSMHWDAEVAELLSVDSDPLSSLSQENFGMSLSEGGTLTVSWDSANDTGISLNEGSLLFELRFQLMGSPGEFSLTTVDSNPTEVEGIKKGIENVDIHFVTGIITVTDTVPVAGKVTYWNQGEPVSDVAIRLEGNERSDTLLTDEDGEFSVDWDAGDDLVISPILLSDFPVDRGVTTLDILLTRRHILNNQTESENLPGPFSILAADVNSDDLVSTQDIVLIRQMILDPLTHGYYTDPGDPMWKFVSSEFDFETPLQPWDFENTRTLDSISGNQFDKDFVAIKSGDVNGSWAAEAPASLRSSQIQSRQHHSNRNQSPYVALQIMPEVNEEGDPNGYQVSIGAIENLTSLQFSVNWEPEDWEYQGITILDSPEIKAENFGEAHVTDGILTFSWDEASLTGLDIERVRPLFRIHLIPNQTNPIQRSPYFSDLPTTIESTADFELIGTRIDRPDLSESIRYELNNSGQFVLKILTETGKRYLIEQNSDLNSNTWETLLDLEGTGEEISASISSGANHSGFFRITVFALSKAFAE